MNPATNSSFFQEAPPDINPFHVTEPNDLEHFITYSPINASSAELLKPIPSNSTLARGGRNDLPAIERELSNVQQENARLRNQLSAIQQPQQEHFDQTHDAQIELSRSQVPHFQGGLSKLVPKDGANCAPVEHTGFSAIPTDGSRVIESNLATGSQAGRFVPLAERGFPRQSYAQPSNTESSIQPPANNAVQVTRESRMSAGLMRGQRRNYSRPFRDSFVQPSRFTSMRKPMDDSQMSSSTTYIDQTEALQLELARTRKDMEALQQQYTELEHRFNSKAGDAIRFGAETVNERDERYCEYFDWIFDFMVETFNVFKQQEIELPPKLVEVYNSICSIDTQ